MHYYFMYSPLDMDANEAYEQANDWLGTDCIVVVRSNGLEIVDLPEGSRPQALPDTYLVRVEPDGSLRIVQKALT